MKPLLERRSRKIGIVGLVTTGVLGLVVVAIFVPFGTRLHAIVEHTAGLRVGEDVKVAGVRSARSPGSSSTATR